MRATSTFLAFVVMFSGPFAAAQAGLIRCEDLLRLVPHADLLSPSRTDSISLVWERLVALNAALSPGQEFTPEQLILMFTRLAHAGTEEQLQLKHLFVPEDDKANHFVTIARGQLGEWELPLRAWMATLLNIKIPSRLEIEIARSSHRVLPDQLNPLELHRYQNLQNEVSRIEKSIGQKVIEDDELKWAAREHYRAVNLLAALDPYRSQVLPPGVSVMSIKRQVAQINAPLRRLGGGLRNENGLVASLAFEKDAGVFAELEFYAALANSNQLTERQDVVRARLLDWSQDPRTPFLVTLKKMIAKEVHDSLEVYARGSLNPNYLGPLQTHSLRFSIAGETESSGRDSVMNRVQALRWSEADVLAVGQWFLSTKPNAILASLLGPEPIDTHEEVFAVEVPLDKQASHFAVRLKAKLTPGDFVPLLDTDYQRLIGFEVGEIRETPFTARAQDAFATYPLDLREPLVQLESGSPIGFAEDLPTHLLITRVKLGPHDDENVPGELRSMLNAATRLRDQLSGAPDGEYISVRFLKGNRQVDSQERFLKLENENAYRQRYSGTFKMRPFSQVQLILDRNLRSGTYTLRAHPSLGWRGFRLSGTDWVGQYVAPRR